MVLIVCLPMLVSMCLAIRLLAVWRAPPGKITSGRSGGRFQPDVEAHKMSIKVLSWPINIWIDYGETVHLTPAQTDLENQSIEKILCLLS